MEKEKTCPVGENRCVLVKCNAAFKESSRVDGSIGSISLFAYRWVALGARLGLGSAFAKWDGLDTVVEK